MADNISGRTVDEITVPQMSNCRLKRTRERLRELLAMVEDEIDGRLGQGGGGLK